jgi:hypothetical protein
MESREAEERGKRKRKEKWKRIDSDGKFLLKAL